ncbi:MAG: threonine/homoserine/homoserine lactone efflux protein [bacterium]|jgi:threonine/homoserine/homoserine lactone efflux protein
MRFFVQLIFKSNLYTYIFILMMLLYLFFFGCFFSFAGSITPSMLNMTALKISLEKGQQVANKYGLAVAIIAIPQVSIAVVLTKYIAENPIILETLEKVGVSIFILLSYYFYSASKRAKIKIEGLKSKKENPLLIEITLSLLNLFAIPFLCGIIILLYTFNLFTFRFVSVLFFTLGAVFGTFYILFYVGNLQK